ncbi:MAG: hypothetical protein K8S25_09790 [Alphaproteobacteria bacterium]|nr:hypothetical protein [Alphaproteobacteria bacterium]
MTAHRFVSAGLWVFERNVRARAFYERLGGVRGDSNSLDFDGTVLTELANVWRDISDLRQRTAELGSAGV